MQVNLLGHIKLINLLAPNLIEQRKGSIINIGSMSGKTTQFIRFLLCE